MAKVEELKKQVRPMTWGEFIGAGKERLGEEMQAAIYVVELQFAPEDLAGLPVYDVLDLYHEIVKTSYQKKEAEKNS